VVLGPHLDDEGQGVAPAHGLEVVVPGALPGERARIEIAHVGVHGRAFAELLEVLEPSPDRITAICPRFLDCGGCDLLHASAAFQARFKRQRVIDALYTEGLRGVEVDPCVASPQILGYRALAKMIVGPDGTLGSYAPRSHDIVDMGGCRVHAPVIEGVLDVIRGALLPEHDLRYVLVRAALADQKVIVTLVVRSADALTPPALLPLLIDRPEVVRVVMHVNDGASDVLLGAGPDVVLLDRGPTAERIGEVEQGLDSGAFAQINPAAASELYRLAAEGLRPHDRTILDLYAGSGGLSLTLAAQGARSVIGVERSPEAVRAATISGQKFGAKLRFIAASVEDAIDALPRADAVAVNPPRKGLSRTVIAALLRRAPVDLVYVSCDPGTLARDLATMGSGARIARVTPVDLFPQTRHVETVVTLRLELPSP